MKKSTYSLATKNSFSLFLSLSLSLFFFFGYTLKHVGS